MGIDGQEYLLRVEEVKRWLEVCLTDHPLPPANELEEFLRPGVTLAYLAKSFDRTAETSEAKVYDPDMDEFLDGGLKYKHTDNINLWFNAMTNVKFPKIFFPETNDLYEGKNLPKVIYCLHALSFYLDRVGLVPTGLIPLSESEMTFTCEQKKHAESQLKGMSLPQFQTANVQVENELTASKEKMIEKRKLISNEILETEIRYNEGLERLYENFEKPLRSVDHKGDHIIPIASSDKIFSNTKLLRCTSAAILPKMKTGQTTDAIIFLYPFIRDLYTDYVVSYRQSITEITKQKSLRVAFATFLHDQPESLEALLLTPVQRVPRYLLLFVSLLSCYDEVDPIYKSLKEAVKVISSVADEMNEKVREHENYQAIEDVRARLWGPGTPTLHVPGRKLIRTGDVYKQLAKDPTQKHLRRLFLFNDILIYAIAYEDKNYTATAVKGAVEAGHVVKEKAKGYMPKGLRDFGRKLKENAGDVLYNPNPNLSTFVFKASMDLQNVELSDTDHQFFKISYQGRDYRFESIDEQFAWISDLTGAIKTIKKKQ